MKVRGGFASSSVTSALVLGAFFSFLGVTAVNADGPVGPGTLPGGVLVQDPDGPEAWGRAGGRTIQFTVNNPGDFTALTWGALGGGAVTMAFDDAIDAFGETLTLGTVANGVAQWNGSASLPLLNQNALVLTTRFRLTVVDGSSNPVPLVSDPGGNQPGLDALSVGGQFSAHLLFEANHNGSFGVPAGWTPVLDLFDHPNLPTIPGTPPGTTGPVLTGFDSGFFFETPQGLTVEEHDTNMFSQTGMIKDALAFLTTDAINRLMGLGQGQTNIDTRLNLLNSSHVDVLSGLQQILQVLQSLPTNELPPGIATADDVREARDELQNILLILFGVMPCPDDAGGGCPPGQTLQLFATPQSVQTVREDVEALLTKVMDIQDTLEASASMPEIDVQVAEVHASKRSRRWILTTTVNGKLVDASLVRIVAITVDKSFPANTADVIDLAVRVPLGQGLLDVMVEIPKELKKASVFQFDVFFDEGAITAHGSAFVHTVK